MTCLVTGANRGLGLALAKEGLSRGHTVVAGCRSVSPELEALQREYGERLIPLPLDVADEESVMEARKALEEKVGTLGGIVNNAAVLFGSKFDTADPITAADLHEYEVTFNVNVLGVVRVCKHFMPLLYQSTGTRCLINVTSEGAVLKDTGHHYTAYGASKCGLNGYTQRIRNYLAGREETRDIRVAMVHPGRMFTDMGVENAQIQPAVPAAGIWDMLEGKEDITAPVPFYNYDGKLMT